MDDNRFDDTIKSKLGEYEDPVFDPTALAAFHHQIGSVSVLPWYSHYRTELMVGSGFLASTLIILWSQWFMNSNTHELLNEKIIALQTQQEEINNLQNQISELKNSPPDTIRIVEIREQPAHYYSSLLYRIKLLEANGSNRRDQAISSVSENKTDSDFSEQSNEEHADQLSFNPNVLGPPYSSRLSPRTTERESIHAIPDNSIPLTTASTKNLDTKTIRDIENHYRKGVGIRVGPTVEFSKGKYTEGESDMSVSYGVLGDFIVSPSLSLETGLKYTKRYYEITDTKVFQTFPLPGVDETIGTIKKAEIDSWMVEIPLTLKYRYPLSLKTNVLGGIGYSTLLYYQQIFEYDYSFAGGGDGLTVGSVYETKQTSFYSGSLNIAIGVSNQLKNKKILETSLFYQYGIGDKGIERVNANFLGVRGVFWFKIR